MLKRSIRWVALPVWLLACTMHRDSKFAGPPELDLLPGCKAHPDCAALLSDSGAEALRYSDRLLIKAFRTGVALVGRGHIATTVCVNASDSSLLSALRRNVEVPIEAEVDCEVRPGEGWFVRASGQPARLVHITNVVRHGEDRAIVEYSYHADPTDGGGWGCFFEHHRGGWEPTWCGESRID